ncbi:MAG: diguanylate cyclase [Microcoleaceae cyanobacterium]
MIFLPNYQILAKIYGSDRSEVYRAIRDIDGQIVILKVLKEDYPTPLALTRYEQEYKLISTLNLEGVIKAYSLEKYQKTLVIILEDFGGESLRILTEKETFSLRQIIEIAIQITISIRQIHSESIIHKDINPSNIVYNCTTKQLKIIDFGISTQLTRENPIVKNPKVLEGTLAYISPEQTGRMNRGIDYRTDFYSLGVTLFQLLTGKLPFQCTDPMELVHCHIAEAVKFPVAQEEREIPEVLQAIVLKLMAKNAEYRYQSVLGLKHDLERCLQQLEATGKISSFELGERDKSDRFLIPEKLYGREAELQTLLDAFERVATGAKEMMLVVGLSGVGKTAVINEVHKPIVKQRGYFIKGKFDQFNQNIPFSAFVQAFRELMGDLLGESDVNLANWKAKILEAVGENGQVIVEVIPELEHIIGQQPPIAEISDILAQNRFNLLFSKFVRVFSKKEHPLAIFLDDLQWADSASLNLLELLMDDSETGYVLVLGAYRDCEVFPAHPLMLSLAKLHKQCDCAAQTDAKETPTSLGGFPRGCRRTQVSPFISPADLKAVCTKGAPRENQGVISTITLQPLTIEHLNQLVTDTLSCGEQLAQPLTELLYQKNQGNPFFTIQFFKSLYEDGLIWFNLEFSYWECDLAKVYNAAAADDILIFMAGRLNKLSDATQKSLKLAACIGNHFDLQTLALVSEQSVEKTAANLWEALKENLVLPMSESYKFFQGFEPKVEDAQTISVGYRFLHDQVQQAAYSLISEEKKRITHLKIGRLLLNQTAIENIENKVFEIINQMNQGLDLILEPSQKRQLAELNFIAAKKAKISNAYISAFEYSEIALSLLPENSWQQDYEFALSLYELAVETAYLTGNFTIAETLINILFERAVDVLDKVKACQVKVQILLSQNRLLEAIQVALKFLCLLGINLPENPDEVDMERALSKINIKLAKRSIESLIYLPIMSDKKQLASMRILSSILNAAYLGLPNLLPIIVAKEVELSMNYGNMDVSPSAYANYGLILCGFVDDIASGYQCGNLAVNLLNKIYSKEFYAKTIEIVCLSVKHWKEHINSTLELLLEGYKIGLESGDFESASFAAYDYCAHSFVLGKNLTELEQEMSNYSVAINKLQQRMVFNLNELHRQTVLNLIDNNESPFCLKGKAYDEEKMLPIHTQDNDLSSLALFYIDKLFLCYLFGEIYQAIEIATQAESYLKGIPGQVFVPLFYLYDSLSWLSLYPNLEEIDKERAMIRILSHQTKMEKWADYAPMNYTHKLYLIKAEKHRVLSENIKGMEMYDQAIAGAKENEYLQEEALANELAAKFYLQWGKEKVAAEYIQEAYHCYNRWGALAKTKQLEKTYSQLLIPILQKYKLHPNSRDSKTTTTTIHTVTTNTCTLDLASVIKASQAISEEMELHSLLSKLMHIVLENAGANVGALILNNSGTWEIAAQCINGNYDLSTIPLKNTNILPSCIINTVKRTRQTLLVNNIQQDQTFAREPELMQQQAKSLCCTPILNQGKLIGLLYLENSLTAGAFTAERVEILKILSSQAAISIENARLYTKVRENESRLGQFLDAIPLGIGILDTSGDVYYTNHAAEILLGRKMPDHVSSDQFPDIYQIYYAGTNEKFPAGNLPAVLALGGESVRIDNIEMHQDGRIIPLEVLGKPLYNEQGDIIYGITIFQDITERKQAEKILADYNQTLEQEIAERTAQLQQANQELLCLANLDGLTQIPNRRHFDKSLVSEWELHLRQQLPLSLILIDIDYFKRYNDRYGHQGGDDCLIRVAQAIARVAQRATDLVARYGGEEFVVILPKTNAEGGLHIAESIRTGVATLSIPHAESEVSEFLSLSIGVSSIIPTDKDSSEDLIAMADMALYGAKKQGRDRVILFGTI